MKCNFIDALRRRELETVRPIRSARRHPERAHRAAGAVGYVLKQSPSAELLRAIRTVAAGGRHMDPRLPGSRLPRDARRRTTTPPVTQRELEVRRMTALGHSNKEMATAMNISIKTVEVQQGQRDAQTGSARAQRRRALCRDEAVAARKLSRSSS
jgi:DNA-binding NarL/FixJ family response regulator